MNLKKYIIAKWGAIAKVSKKVGKVAMLGAVLTGGVVGSVIAGNQTNVSAIWSNKWDTSGYDNGHLYQQGEDIETLISNYGSGEWYPSDATKLAYNNDKTTPAGRYVISFEPDAVIVNSKFVIKLKFGNAIIYEGTYSNTNRVTYMFDVDSSNVNQFLTYDIVDCLGELPTPGTNDLNTIYLRNFRWELYDTMAPAMETQVFLTDVDSPVSLDYLLSQVKFIDEVDGELPVTTSDVTSDNYSSNKNKVGKWQIVISKTDAAGNTGIGTIEVWVQDKTGPIITGQSTFTSNMSAPLTEESIRSQLTATDNVDGNVEIKLVSDNFTGNENVVGSKTIVYRATDAAGNVSADYTITVNCVDDIKPTLTGESSYTTGYKNVISDSTIKEALTLNDNITSNLTLEEVSNNYRGNESIPGTYQIKYRTTDGAGNISEIFTVTIEVTDKIPPVFYVNSKFIGISQADTLTHQELVNLLIYMEGLIEEEGAAVSLLSFGGYEPEMVNAPGVYTLSYKTRTADGVESEVKTATIKVLGEVDEEEKPSEVEEEKGFWEKFADFFADLWEKVCNWFKAIFKKD